MKKYWQNINDLAARPLHDESQDLPGFISEISNPINRRKFLSLMGASMALAGFVGCRRPLEHIVPYVKAPEEIIPGVANYYATTMPFGNNAYGLVVESHEGRPTKIEGNKDHPSTLGRSNPFIQASILSLYDPDRSKTVTHNGADSTWENFISFWRGLSPGLSANGGAGLAILCEPFSSPTLEHLKEQFNIAYPHARWVTYEPVSDENIFTGLMGLAKQPICHFEKARVILSLDSDFLYAETDSIRNAKGFIDGRRIKSEHDDMNRLYVAESAYTVTGAMADHRLAIPSSDIGYFAVAVAKELKRQGLTLPDSEYLDNFTMGHFDNKWISAVASDLLNAKGEGLIIAGRNQPARVHALVLALNSLLDNIGKSIGYRYMYDDARSSLSNLSGLCDDLKRGEISTLVILNGNPVYNTPSDLVFGDLLKNVKNTIHLSEYANETSSLCQWHLPETHFLESWGDARSIDGTLSVIQPLIAPLYDGRSLIEVINLITNGQEARGYDLVRDTWKINRSQINFERDWQRLLNDGLYWEKPSSEIVPEIIYKTIFYEATERSIDNRIGINNLEINFRPSNTIFDGRFANNAWLQELPDPLTKITWDNAALVSPKTAQDLSLSNGDMVKLNYHGQELEMPIYIMPGQADNTFVLPLGYGRKNAGQVGNNIGFDTYQLRTSTAPYFDSGLTLEKTGATYLLATTQVQGTTVDRPVVREASLAYYREHPNFAPEMVETGNLKSLWNEIKFDKGNQWGMAIDLNLCIGCNACTIACQSENNIPVVGKTQVSKSRWMHWIRVDRYFTGDPNSPEIVHQPVPCMHCENAPCEEVCPVNAAVHDHEGLNLQVYNRCIGTRYCSNNCPYKVRRFNFFNYTGKTPETVKMLNNPNVTVRGRGVMEKCTYCLQRIKKGEIAAKAESREIRDGEVMPACAQACPTNAIIFGLISDPQSRVTETKKQNRNYGMLTEYNTRPRTTYLARIRNPHPDLETDEAGSKS